MGFGRAKPMTARRFLQAVALVSLVYDVVLGISLLFFQERIVAGFGLDPPNYPVNGNLNGLFALCVGLGYLAPFRRPEENRWYLWLMGVGLKGAGPLVFLYDLAVRSGPRSFLWFALSDGALAALTFVALAGFSAASARADLAA